MSRPAFTSNSCPVRYGQAYYRKNVHGESARQTAERRIQEGVPGCPGTSPFDWSTIFGKNIFQTDYFEKNKQAETFIQQFPYVRSLQGDAYVKVRVRTELKGTSVAPLKLI